MLSLCKTAIVVWRAIRNKEPLDCPACGFGMGHSFGQNVWHMWLWHRAAPPECARLYVDRYWFEWKRHSRAIVSK